MLYFYNRVFADFQCRQCGACCRRDWLITVDYDSYQRNQHLFRQCGREAEFEQAFSVAETAGLKEYAIINKSHAGACWFLAADNRCWLHQQAGHEHLDLVCQTFPRYPINSSRGIEITLSFSCPAVIDLAATTAWETVRSELAPSVFTASSFVKHVYPQQYAIYQPLRYYFELEQYFIMLLQERQLPMSTRLERIAKVVRIISLLPLTQVATVIGRLTNTYSSAIKINTSELSFLSPSQLLVENFFVNMVFKKLFYQYGLEQGAIMLQSYWQRLSRLVVGSTGISEDLKQEIIQIEIEVNHFSQSTAEHN